MARFLGSLRAILREPLGLLGLSLVVLVVLGAVMADVLAVYNPTKINPVDRLQGPSLAHFLGTDQLGRDLFSRALYGLSLIHI